MNTFIRLIALNTARLVFVGALLLALYAGLTWALSPEERPDAASIAAAQAELDASESELAEPSETPTPVETAAAPLEPTEVPTTESPEQLIAAAKPPGETTVQVLDAGGGGARVDQAEAVLEQLGYNVVARSPSSRDVVETTGYYTADNIAEAEGRRAREPRFRVVEANRGLSEGVDIHVLVGTEF